MRNILKNLCSCCRDDKSERDEKKIERHALMRANGYYDRIKAYIAEGILWSVMFSLALLFAFGVI